MFTFKQTRKKVVFKITTLRPTFQANTFICNLPSSKQVTSRNIIFVMEVWFHFRTTSVLIHIDYESWQQISSISYLKLPLARTPKPLLQVTPATCVYNYLLKKINDKLWQKPTWVCFSIVAFKHLRLHCTLDVDNNFTCSGATR